MHKTSTKEAPKGRKVREVTLKVEEIFLDEKIFDDDPDPPSGGGGNNRTR